MALFISKYLRFFIFRLSEIELIARFSSTAKSGFILAIFLFSINPRRYPSQKFILGLLLSPLTFRLFGQYPYYFKLYQLILNTYTRLLMNSEIVSFSHRYIAFNKDKPFVLEITNKSQTLGVIYKIKTTKLNTYEVKPPQGAILSGEKKSVEFKLIKPLTEQELAQARSKDKFQFQFLTVPPKNIPKSKTQYKALWDDAKSDPQKQLGIANFTFPIQGQGESSQLASVNTEPFSPLKPKNSQLKSESKNVSAKKSFTLQADPKKDEELSKQFQKLKEKQEKLLEERQKVFNSQAKGAQKESKGGAQMVLLIIAFLLSVLIGNFLKLRVFVAEQL